MSIIVSDISFHYFNQDPLFEHISFSVVRNSKVAIIGDNGTGKSTLLKLIASKLKPSDGTIACSSVPFYIAQQTEMPTMTIAQALAVEGKLAALGAISKGSADQIHYDILDDDWQIRSRCESVLSKWNLSDLDLDSPIDILSGGERAKLFLAALMIHRPSIILLDEPTNHLDYAARDLLYDYIDNVKATVIVVSHDRALLNRIDTTLELSSKSIKLYGGNYDFYSAQKQLEISALQDSVDSKEKNLREVRLKAQQMKERQDRRDRRGEKNKDQLVPIMRKTMLDRAQSTGSKLKDKHAQIIQENRDQLSELRSKQESNCLLKIDFDDAQLHNGKLLVAGTEVNYEYATDIKLWSMALDFEIYSGQRIHIKGNNGTGKTTLLKLLTGEFTPTSGEIKRFVFSYVYLDQHYSSVNVDMTVLELAQKYNCDNLAEHEIKMRLHRALFDSGMWDRSCMDLSSGEKMRLYLCCLMISNHIPDMFILDEPTNNLDLSSLQILSQTIKTYRGTLIAISHDRRFIEEIGMTDEIILTN